MVEVVVEGVAGTTYDPLDTSAVVEGVVGTTYDPWDTTLLTSGLGTRSGMRSDSGLGTRSDSGLGARSGPLDSHGA